MLSALVFDFWVVARSAGNAPAASCWPTRNAAAGAWLAGAAAGTVIAVAVAGAVFGREAVQGEIVSQLQGLIGRDDGVCRAAKRARPHLACAGKSQTQRPVGGAARTRAVVRSDHGGGVFADGVAVGHRAGRAAAPQTAR